MSEQFEMVAWPDLETPVLVVALGGWIDAGNGAQAAMELLDIQLDAQVSVRFDGDTFIDYRARRPTMRLIEGINAALVWPEIVLKSAKDRQGHGVLLLMGAEPDTSWHRFADIVASLAIDLDVRMMVGLGAYPYAAPHTRPSRLSVTASSPDLAAGMAVQRSTLDVPAGIESVLEQALADKGIPTIGLWAQVPHYVANVPYPAASLALLEGLSQLTGVVTDQAGLQAAARDHQQRLDELVANSEEHTTMVRQLEQAWQLEAAEAAAQAGGADGSEPLSGFGLQADNLPSGDDLAAELERFLRDQGR